MKYKSKIKKKPKIYAKAGLKKQKMYAKADSKGSEIKSVKGVSVSGLNKRQAQTLDKHSIHHTAKHIREMVKSMKAGKTFTQSHKDAMKKVGK